MVFEAVKCPYCGSYEVVCNGKSPTGKQRYKCCNPECSRKSSNPPGRYTFSSCSYSLFSGDFYSTQRTPCIFIEYF